MLFGLCKQGIKFDMCVIYEVEYHRKDLVKYLWTRNLQMCGICQVVETLLNN